MKPPSKTLHLLYARRSFSHKCGSYVAQSMGSSLRVSCFCNLSARSAALRARTSEVNLTSKSTCNVPFSESCKRARLSSYACNMASASDEARAWIAVLGNKCPPMRCVSCKALCNAVSTYDEMVAGRRKLKPSPTLSVETSSQCAGVSSTINASSEASASLKRRATALAHSSTQTLKPAFMACCKPSVTLLIFTFSGSFVLCTPRNVFGGFMMRLAPSLYFGHMFAGFNNTLISLTPDVTALARCPHINARDVSDDLTCTCIDKYCANSTKPLCAHV
mmetsp:Transcript_7144/g.26133  ORF Transcript_7144/g.26133 Transcript_7144/m.26133 type:complete len:277 (+) Transcript_7144:339-1169(+)